MPLQTENLVLLGLGVLNDKPPNRIQPKLTNGIHLRWAFSREAGFPLHGFYLFRRLHKQGQPICLGGFSGHHAIGISSSNILDTPSGQFSSNRKLVFTDDFPASGKVEIDLRNRDYLRFTLPPGSPARQIDTTIGFYPKEIKSQICIRFSLNSEQLGPNPRTDEDVSFYVKDLDGNPYSHTKIAHIVTDLGPIGGLDCGAAIEIILPCPSTIVELILTYSSVRASIEILNEDGTAAKRQHMKNPPGKPETVKLTGNNIKRVVVHSPEPQLLLHQVCFTCNPRGLEEKNEVYVTGFSGDVPVMNTLVQGASGEVKSISLKSDSISAVEFRTDATAAAALLDLCVVSILQDSTTSWESVEEFPYPLCMPVTHPDYPCSSGISENLPKDRQTAKERIFYGKPDDFFSEESATIYSAGTISIAKDSPIVLGNRTEWNDSLVGSVFKADGDVTAYTILAVISNDRLVLSRNFAGPSRADSAYAIKKDDFGVLHDLLVHLVAKDSVSSPMAQRFIPSDVYNAGTITVDEKNPTIISGVGTDWKPDLVGLKLRIIGYSDGWISLGHGSPIVNGFGTTWNTSLSGMALHISGESTDYVISSVDPIVQQLVLTEEFTGETEPSKLYTYSIVERPEYTIKKVDPSAQQITIDKEYIGSRVGAKRYSIFADLKATTDSTDDISPRIPKMNPLDLVLLSGLHPAFAQMLGLYWIDRTAKPGESYDYMLVADYTGIGGQDSEKILDLISKNDFDNIEAYIAYDLKVAPAPALEKPEGLRCYALPGGFNKIGGTNNVGIRWNLNTLGPDRLLAPGSPIMYNIWRSYRGNDTLPQIAELSEEYHLINNDPVGIASQAAESDTKSMNIEDWPPFSMYYIDSGVKDGWYSYQISGIDIFGRHSPTSEDGQWYQWTPVPDPRPWYYQEPSGDVAIYPSAIKLLDKIPPPAPTGIEAYALDPLDAMVLKDDAYNKWWNGLIKSDWYKALPDKDKKDLIGLRVRWKWTRAHMNQAPDIREFRIYYHPDRMNVLLGKIQDVKIVTSTETEVQTDIPNSKPENAFEGAWLMVGSKSFEVVRNSGTDPLRLRVKNIGRTYAKSSISLSTGSTNAIGTDTNWDDGLVGLSLQVQGESEIYAIAKVNSPTQLTLSTPYTGKMDIHTPKAYLIFEIRPPINAPCSVSIPKTYSMGSVEVEEGSSRIIGKGTAWNDRFTGMQMKIDGSVNTFVVKSVLPPTEILLNRNFDGKKASGKAYSIQFPLYVDYTIANNWDRRLYVVEYDEHFTIPAIPVDAATRQYEIFLPAIDGISTEGLPLKPSLSEPIVYAHIGVSAADSQELTPDSAKWSSGEFGGRYGNEGQVGFPPLVLRVLREKPDKPMLPPPDSDKVYATPADYHGHSFYTYRWMPVAHLKAHIFRALDDAIFRIDWSLRPRRLPLSAEQSQFFPPEFDTAKLHHIADELNLLNTFDNKTLAMTYYNKLSNDALRVLAGLPGNDKAFTQLTIKPLDPNDLANADTRGPDSPDGYVSKSKLRAYIDTLDGRSDNRYFYRVAFIDSAHNQSELSLSSPPVWLPKITPPRTPVITKVFAGDPNPDSPNERKISLQWGYSREPDLKEYRIYRTHEREKISDIHLMTHVHSEMIPPGDPIWRSQELTWTDILVRPLITFYYRITAVDNADHESQASNPVSARGIDDAIPIPPRLIISWVDSGSGSIRAEASWSSIDDSLLQRRKVGIGWWIAISDWSLPGSYKVLDKDSDPRQSYEYRLRVKGLNGATCIGNLVKLDAIF
jgi:hypothetical protein